MTVLLKMDLIPDVSFNPSEYKTDSIPRKTLTQKYLSSWLKFGIWFWNFSEKLTLRRTKDFILAIFAEFS